MKTKIDLARCDFLRAALAYIESHPGCTKRDAVLGVGYSHSPNGRMPNRTYSYRNSALGRLISAGLVRNEGHGGRYALFAVK